MNAGIGTACLPTIQTGLGLLQALKAFCLERSLGVADAGFNFSFADVTLRLSASSSWNTVMARRGVIQTRLQRFINLGATL